MKIAMHDYDQTFCLHPYPILLGDSATEEQSVRR